MQTKTGPVPSRIILWPLNATLRGLGEEERREGSVKRSCKNSDQCSEGCMLCLLLLSPPLSQSPFFCHSPHHLGRRLPRYFLSSEEEVRQEEGTSETGPLLLGWDERVCVAAGTRCRLGQGRVHPA